MKAIAKCSSHRARGRLLSALSAHGVKSEAVHDYGRSSHYGAYRIDANHATLARAVKGVTIARTNPDDWGTCWETGD